MNIRSTLIAAGVACAASVACGGDDAAHLGRWERAGQPGEWVEFRRDGTFRAQIPGEPNTFGGRFQVRGDTLLIRSEYGHAGRAVVEDDWLVHADGTRMRRARR